VPQVPARARVHVRQPHEEHDIDIDKLFDSLNLMSALDDTAMSAAAAKDFKKFSSGNARITLAFSKEVSARIAQNYRQGLLAGINVPHAQMLNFIGQHMAEQSLAQRAHESAGQVAPLYYEVRADTVGSGSAGRSHTRPHSHAHCNHVCKDA
jgi:hypothetical protein